VRKVLYLLVRKARPDGANVKEERLLILREEKNVLVTYYIVLPVIFATAVQQASLPYCYY
jgi:hypothetical protein